MNSREFGERLMERDPVSERRVWEVASEREALHAERLYAEFAAIDPVGLLDLRRSGDSTATAGEDALFVQLMERLGR